MLIDTNVYSNSEMEMIEHFGYADIASMCNPLSLYRMMVEKAFIDNDRTKWADALRRCMIALNVQSRHEIYRMTPEWDALIKDEEWGKEWLE